MQHPNNGAKSKACAVMLDRLSKALALPIAGAVWCVAWVWYVISGDARKGAR